MSAHNSVLRADQQPYTLNNHYRILKCTDQIHLQEWLQRKGDYQGDFLIPEGWRRIIYKRNKISGMARLSDLRDEYKQTSLKLYDADTWIALGGAGFVAVDQQDTTLFSSSSAGTSAHQWQSPVFSIKFSQEKEALHSAVAEKPVSMFMIQSSRYARLQSKTPVLMVSGYPEISEFFSRVPSIVESARVQDVGMTRACPGTYYWLWAWDNMVTALAQAHWGDLTNLQRLVEFIRTHRDIDGAIPGRWTKHLEPMDSRGIGAMDFLFSEVVLALFRETEDRTFLRSNYAVLVHAFNHLAARTNEQGFFPSIGMYPDLPQKMGRTTDSYVAIDEGAWYGLCRNVEKIAWLLDDHPTAKRSSVIAEKISQNFNATFFCEDKGFLCDSYNPHTKSPVTSYPLFSLLALESPLCYPLINGKEQACATFIVENLLDEHGISLTPPWDVNHTSEPALSAWYPHWDIIAIKMLSFAGKTAELYQWLSLVNECFTTLGYCPEFVSTNVAPTEKWKYHGAAWNLNCASGWYQALLFAVAGLDFDIDGVTCHSTAGMPHYCLEGLFFKGGRWTVQKTGAGQFISGLKIDGKVVTGSLKIPTCHYTKDQHHLMIHYTTVQPSFPQLARLDGAALIDVRVSGNKTVCLIKGFGLTDARITLPVHAVLLDNIKIPVSRNGNMNTGYCQFNLSGEHELMIVLI